MSEGLRLIAWGLSVLLAPGLSTAQADEGFQRRCGWFDNPSPGNVWLIDRDGEWTHTNMNYGYGCACLDVRVDRETFEVLAVKSATALPLSCCRRDPALRAVTQSEHR